MAKKPHRLDDKRGSGRGDNVKSTVYGSDNGGGKSLFNNRIRKRFNNSIGSNGKTKRAS